MKKYYTIASATNIKFFDVKRRINFYLARRFFNGVAVVTARKTNTAGENLGKLT